jgi:anti-sigma factor RsiW
MSFNEVLAELPGLSVTERQRLIRHVLELDDSGLSPSEERVVEARLAEHLANPATTVSLDEMTRRLRSRFGG